MGKTGLDEQRRLQFTVKELRVIRNSLVSKYHNDRRNLYWRRKRVALGEADSRAYPIADVEKNLKFMRRLLKKISKYTGVRWCER